MTDSIDWPEWTPDPETDPPTLDPEHLKIGDRYVVHRFEDGADREITIEVIGEREPHTDLFGREQFKYMARREDTGHTGYMIYGPGASSLPIASPLVSGKTTDEVSAAVDQVKAEVREDMTAGRVPRAVRSFSQLHDFVDANTYGGFTDSRADWSTEDLIRVQDAVHAWLKAGHDDARPDYGLGPGAVSTIA